MGQRRELKPFSPSSTPARRTGHDVDTKRAARTRCNRFRAKRPPAPIATIRSPTRPRSSTSTSAVSKADWQAILDEDASKANPDGDMFAPPQCMYKYQQYRAEFRCGDSGPWLKISLRKKRGQERGNEAPQKPPLKIDFNQDFMGAVPEANGQSWPATFGDLGYRKLTLANGQGNKPPSRTDNLMLPILMTEHVALRLLKREVPATPSTAYAKVYLHLDGAEQGAVPRASTCSPRTSTALRSSATSATTTAASSSPPRTTASTRSNSTTVRPTRRPPPGTPSSPRTRPTTPRPASGWRRWRRASTSTLCCARRPSARSSSTATTRSSRRPTGRTRGSTTSPSIPSRACASSSPGTSTSPSASSTATAPRRPTGMASEGSAMLMCSPASRSSAGAPTASRRSASGRSA